MSSQKHTGWLIACTLCLYRMGIPLNGINFVACNFIRAHLSQLRCPYWVHSPHNDDEWTIAMTFSASCVFANAQLTSSSCSTDYCYYRTTTHGTKYTESPRSNAIQFILIASYLYAFLFLSASLFHFTRLFAERYPYWKFTAKINLFGEIVCCCDELVVCVCARASRFNCFWSKLIEFDWIASINSIDCVRWGT